MQVFQDLRIDGGTEEVGRWLEAVTLAIDSGWRRDGMHEKGLRGYYCFAREATGDTPEVLLFLHEECHGLRLANIVPRAHSLDAGQHNAILVDFCTRIAEAAGRDIDVEVILSPDAYSLEDAFPPRVLRKLRRLADSANKSTYPGHPLDWTRWLEFLVTAHRCEANIDEGTFERLLKQDLGWEDYPAAELARDYRFALDVLRFYDAQPRED
jgi:hypothetical protein